MLYEDICSLHKEGKISVNPDIQEQLQAESTKIRSRRTSSLITPGHRKCARELRENKDIIVRRADKASMFVIMNRTDYMGKVQSILQDDAKFRRIQRNPTEALKKRLNALIDTANAEVGGVKFQRIVGDYNPGYFYGNVKTHKNGNPLRPIISQIPMPSYNLAKKLNNIITPYIPTRYSLKSVDEFIDILSGNRPRGMLASLDVESLFTNVPVEDTIDIIVNNVYSHPSLPPPRIPRQTLRDMLRACTMEAPFRCPNGHIYYQQDGVAIGSPLGVLFAQALMCHVENEVLQEEPVNPFIYCRYVDDIFVDIKDEEKLQELKQRMEEVSGLRFTVERSVENRIPFLDVDIHASNGAFTTQVYRKPTDAGCCLNGESECPERYKLSVIRAYVHRALRNCSSWPLLHQELNRIKQILTNNSYSTTDIDNEISRQMNKYLCTTSSRITTGTTYKLYYKNTMSPAYKKDEKVLKDIIESKCRPNNPDDKIDLIIYYQSPRVSSLVMKNNLNEDPAVLKKTNVVYLFKCNTGGCALRSNASYIGHTTTTLSRRVTSHLQEGGPKRHLHQQHGETLTRDQMTSNIKILTRSTNRRKLQVLESIFIRDMDPLINRQMNARGTLSLYDGPPVAARNTNSNRHGDEEIERRQRTRENQHTSIMTARPLNL